jgi:hypothetical protein
VAKEVGLSILTSRRSPIILMLIRGVAQRGSAPRLGRGGRRFKSAHPDLFILYDSQEVLVRGKRVSRQARKLDVIVVAVRYNGSHDRISMVRGHERRGFVWGDQVLLDREALMDRMRANKRVVTGRRASLEGDFEVFASVRVMTLNQRETLVAEGCEGEGDNLGLPLF